MRDSREARSGSRVTLAFETFGLTLASAMLVAVIARLAGEHDMRLSPRRGSVPYEVVSLGNARLHFRNGEARADHPNTLGRNGRNELGTSPHGDRKAQRRP
jgi:hypothetical protein